MTQYKTPYSFYGSPLITSVGSSEVKPFIHFVDLLSTVKVAIDNEVGTGSCQKEDVLNVLRALRNTNSSSFKKDGIETSKQNLISAWMDEAALYDSMDNGAFKFPGWSIIKFYYGIYHGVSSIARTLDPNMDESNHNIKIRVFNTMLVNNKNMANYLLPPLSVTFDIKLKNYRFANPIRTDGHIGRKDIETNLKECLDFTYNMHGPSYPTILSLFNMFKVIREYVNYYGTGATRFLYGVSVKEGLMKSLPYISFYFQVMVENYLIVNVGYSDIKRMWDEFKDAMTINFGVSFNRQQIRFDTYSSFFRTL